MATTVHQTRHEYLTVAQVGAELGVTKKHVYRKVASGELPATQLGGSGSALRIPRAGLDAWLWSKGVRRSA